MSFPAARDRHQFDEVVATFLSEEDGATATEYSIVVRYIALIIMTGVGAFGTALNIYSIGLTTGAKTPLGLR